MMIWQRKCPFHHSAMLGHRPSSMPTCTGIDKMASASSSHRKSGTPTPYPMLCMGWSDHWHRWAGFVPLEWWVFESIPSAAMGHPKFWLYHLIPLSISPPFLAAPTSRVGRLKTFQSKTSRGQILRSVISWPIYKRVRHHTAKSIADKHVYKQFSVLTRSPIHTDMLRSKMISNIILRGCKNS